jgi:acetoin utilization protein AcuB
MSLVVAINGIYHPYFKPQYVGHLNQETRGVEEFKHSLKSGQFIPKEESNKAEQYRKSSLTDYQHNSKQEKTKRVNVFAKDIMSKDIHAINLKYSAIQAMHHMKHLKVHHLLIKDLESLEILGLVSDRDLLRSFDQHGSPQKSLKEVMSREVLLCHVNTEIRLIAKVMIDEGISCLPVMDEKKQLVGMITRTDLLNCIVRNMPLEVLI